MQGKIADAADVVGVGVEGTLCQRDGRGRPLRELVGPVLDGGVEVGSRNDLVDQSHFAGLFGGVAVVDEPDLARLLVTDVAGQEGGAPAGIDRTDLWADLSELSGVGGNRQIAQRCQNISTPDGKAIDARDDGLRNVPDQPLQLVDRQPYDAAAVILSFVRGLVAARAESLVACTGQHDARDIAVVRGEVEGLNQFFERLAAKGVIELGPIDDDPGGTIADFVDYI